MLNETHFVTFYVHGTVHRTSLSEMTNKMQLYTVYFKCKLLYMFRVVSAPIIRSTNNCIYSIWYWSTVAATCRYKRQVAATVETCRVAYRQNKLCIVGSCWTVIDTHFVAYTIGTPGVDNTGTVLIAFILMCLFLSFICPLNTFAAN